LERADHSRASAAIDQCLCGRNGLRVEKSTGTTNGTLYWRAVTGETIAESDLTGSTTNSAYVEYIFFDGERIASRNGSSGAVNYYYTDQLGSIVTITDGNGTPCYEATFTPYGQEMPTSLSWTCSTNYKFTGYERDSETGLDYAFARYYSPRLGRFMSADPLAGDVTNPQSLNRYAYVENNPETYIDPWGFARCVKPDGTVTNATNSRACKEQGGTWQPDPPPPGTIFPTCTGVGPCVIGPVKPGGPGGGKGNASDFITKHVCAGNSRVVGAGRVTSPPSIGAFGVPVTGGTAAINPLQFYPGMSMAQAKAALAPYLNTISADVLDPNPKIPSRYFKGVTDVIGGKADRESLANRFPGTTLEINGVPEPAGASTMSYVEWTMSIFVPCPQGTKELIAY
ncbi:MAG TPA: RHS repeat-associated core domain-containing protein, partial [Candidatus Acidoferrales bacterium]|nr:RHS repeat-associated core domain-containing protein [Candidatus Acidoferrales bacterium]